MKLPAKIAIGGVAIYIVVMGASGLFLKSLLSGSDLAETVGQELPIEFETDAVGFDLVAWFKFSPTISLTNLRVKNVEGFVSENILAADEVSARARLLALLQSRVEIPSIVLRKPILFVNRNRGGKTNIEALQALLAKGDTSGQSSDAAGAAALQLDSFLLEDGTVFYSDASENGVDLHIDEISVDLSNVGSGRQADLDLSARLFEGDDSGLSFTGLAGPFSAQSAPAEGELDFRLNPGEVPDTLRRELFGSVLAAPGDSGLIHLTASVAGDLFSSLAGDGVLELDDLLLGQDAESRISVAGEVPLSVNVSNPLTKPGVDLSAKGAELRFADGSWNGDVRLRYDAGVIRGSSHGTVSDFAIEQVLQAFTTSGESAFGRAEVSKYNLAFAGRDAGSIRNSMQGDADLVLREGRIGIFNLAQTIEKHWNKVFNGDEAEAGETEFAEFATSLIIEDQKVRFPEFALDGSGMKATGNGFLGFDKTLDFDIDTWLPVKDGGPTALLSLTGDQQAMQIPVKVTGSVDSPKARPNIGKVAKQQVTKQATSALGSIFGRLTQPKEEEDPAATEPPE